MASALSTAFTAAPARRAVARRSTVQVQASRVAVDSFSKSDIMVAPSILSANFAKLGEQVGADVGFDGQPGGPCSPCWAPDSASTSQKLTGGRGGGRSGPGDAHCPMLVALQTLPPRPPPCRVPLPAAEF